MTTGEESFTGSNGASWPALFTTSGNAGSVQDIQSNRGRLVSATAIYEAARAKSASTAQDIEFVVTIAIENPIVEQYCSFPYRMDDWASLASDNANNGYGIALYCQTGQFELFSVTANVRTHLTNGTAFSPTAGVDFKVRVQIRGSHHRARAWNANTSEPTTWNIDWDDSTYVDAGYWGFSMTAGTATKTAYYDDLVWNDTTPIAPFKRQLVGTQVSNSAATTTVISFTGATKPQIGDLVVMYGSRDNNASDALTGDSFSDGTANSYTRVVNGSNLGTANAGNVGVLFYCFLTVAWSGTQTLTWTHPSRLAAMRMEHWVNLSAVRASGTNSATSTAGAPSVALTTVLKDDTVLAMESIEYSTAGTSTGDSDTTNGSWSALQGPTATTGTTLAATKVISQYKLSVTADGTQTFNPTHSVTTNVDTVAIIAAFMPFKSPPPIRSGVPRAVLTR